MKNNLRPKPLVLVILDGWGYRENTEANAIAAADKPTWDALWEKYPHTLISGSGTCVGLPKGQMGNSEVGHLNMGAGRIVRQDLSRIDAAISDLEFFKNPILVESISKSKKNAKALHVMGLLSPGGVHSHERHIHALIKLASELGHPTVYIHAFLDGRDTPPKSAKASIESLDNECKKHQCGKIISLIGRYYAMDRDKRWDRIEKAYQLIVEGKAEFQANTPLAGLELAYKRDEVDEFVQATVIKEPNSPAIKINDGDTVIFMNFRADRARELTEALTDPHFSGFARPGKLKLDAFICLSEYDARFKLPTAFPPEPLKHLLAECISEAGLKQLRIAETEKYAHVSFFFNGGIENPFPGEDRIMIPSPKVATYDLQPEMSAFELCEQLCNKIISNQYDVIICNFANPDMVGHTGNFKATVKAIETIDRCLKKIVGSLEKAGGELLITADHGNAEQMFDQKTNQAHTAHTSDPVPFVYVGRQAEIANINGRLSDVAPTILYLLGLAIPPEMTGAPLIKLS